ncbi:DUF1810 domain-containing protein [Pseudoflavonifractor phocaeensis]|uniref:DUF1810 domain-containing protein n=1 Tax=Pseudoflavonifractor phocaeensis TaxID=1870988 RepID=UPI00195C4C69|nr:DUF1810 domain-containing protein [Pseudoflavonifractor phocaeensis]MBM6870952.1 DUF1810 domain-containing protein [Pseudoflavonifractor phocaeensis]
MSDLQRFHSAQSYSYETALRELRGGRKMSHWMWYIFPQLTALGKSQTAVYYGLDTLEDAKAYLADPVLGARLVEISRALVELGVTDPHAVMGSPDDKKLRSSMTLFALANPDEPVFRQVLDQYYGGRPDQKTMNLLRVEWR